jgi:catechol 2,3-dioxygenase-like lactoylglutathione lyase family enzyme
MTANRFHVHVHVSDLDANLAFYSRLFGAEPSVRKDDYAKWMLEDPRLNFAISTGKSGQAGIAHLGLQAETPGALAAIGERLRAADAIRLEEAGTTCCYARSDKFWAQDPQGVHWESFHTHGDATTYYADPAGAAVARDGCCGPALASRPAAAAEPALAESDATIGSCKASCGVPASQQVAGDKAACCA